MTDYTLDAQPASDPIYVNPDDGSIGGTGSAGAQFTLTPGNASSIQGTLAADGFHLAYGEPTYAPVYVLTSGFALTESVAPTRATSVFDNVAMVHSTTAAMRYVKALYDLATYQDWVSLAFPATLFDNTSFVANINAARGQLLKETMKLADTPQGAATYGIALLEVFQLQDGLFKFFNGQLTDAMQFADAMLAKYRPTAAVNDGVILTASLNPTLMIGMELDDSFMLGDDEALKAIFNGYIADTANIRALHVEPNGELTTWAINTRNSAVTEYQNWDFNSFAKLGKHYVGANDEGLFLLDGPRDVTDNIPTHVKSGKMSTGSKFTTLHYAYLGMSVVDDDSDSDFFLKMVAGDGREYVYKIKPQPEGMTTKVNMGKGLRSRYFSYELISTGADWDLDAIEFIPIVSKRRV